MKIVRAFKSKYKELKKESSEDLLQECLIHWYYARRKIPPEEIISAKSLMSDIVKKKLMQIIRDYKRHKRKVLSLSDTLDEADNIEDLSSTDPRQHLYKTELRSDLEKAFQKLTPTQKEICRLIIEEGINPTDISRMLAIHRSTVYDEIQKIRKVFSKEGLGEYLK